MGKTLSILLALVIVCFILAFFVVPSFAKSVTNALSFSPCDTPQTYKIGSIDSRFNLSNADLLQAVKQATDTWSQAEGKQLFVYDQDKGAITVNLFYDERQSLTNQISGLHQQVDNEKNVIDPQIAAYQQKVADFKQRVTALNQEIEYWNSKGGAPADEFGKLYNEQQSLKQEEAELNQQSQQLNQSTEQYNGEVSQLNQTIDTFNSTIKQRPEEGLYNGQDDTITIYFMANHTELLHTLTHEFGHALGLGHVPDANAVMYYQTNDQLSLTAEDLQALNEVCRKRTVFELLGDRIGIAGQNLQKLLQQWNFIPG